MRSRLAALCIASILLSSGIAAPVAGSSASHDGPTLEDGAESTLHINLSEGGDATVTLVTGYNFTQADERDAFESLREDEGAQSDLLERFTGRLQSVAAAVDNDSEQAVSEHSVDLRTTDERGLAAFSVTWDGLATVDDRTLTVTEPFASGFETDRTVVLEGPANATLESASHDPTVETDNRATWDAGTDFDGFEAVLSLPTEDSDTGVTGADDTSGLGGLVSVATLAVFLGGKTHLARE
ncbi:DUF7345 domain-containing protein [Halostagnicola kamekurae]|uniref:DUF7345 domain-containing protein n=1 Tax=Halostagnicola kamekurae TaxID=619731 RepID=A0A1I6RK04_9EURY|nr:hypothetical protein [Halostagnicola kamekurae]SFS64976.1 hypothetical protein SAMN04488556_1845 [Halostagnicola kamekurae]